MVHDSLNNRELMSDIDELSEFIDGGLFLKIINKIADYADILTEPKLHSLVNFKYDLNSLQIQGIIDLLLKIQALSKIYTIATKGMKDLEAEYISNIFSEPAYPFNVSSYVNIRTIIENRLTNQVQHYNMNMNKPNPAVAIPVNELKSHVKNYSESAGDKSLRSSKIQHGMIAASLHDAFILLVNREEWWNDNTYIKYFFNDSSSSKNGELLITKKEWKSLANIKERISAIPPYLEEILDRKIRLNASNRPVEQKESGPDMMNDEIADFNDKMLLTPFGRQYGGKIDKIINDIFNENKYIIFDSLNEEILKDKINGLFVEYNSGDAAIDGDRFSDDIINFVDFLLNKNDSAKTFAEKYLRNSKKSPYALFYNENKEKIDNFLTAYFMHYFEKKFSTLFKIIKSQDLKKFACAYILKRIYLKKGDNLSTFGFFLIKAIGRYNGIKAQV